MRAFFKGVGRQFYHQINSTNKFKNVAFNSIKTEKSCIKFLRTKTPQIKPLPDPYSFATELCIESMHFHTKWIVFSMLFNTGMTMWVFWELSGVTALQASINFGCTTITKLLIDSGVDLNHLNKDKFTPLLYAIVMNRTKEAKLLIDAGADPDIVIADFAPALHYAIAQKDIEIVNALIAAGADLNITDKYHRTALHYAILQGNTEAANALIAAGANPNILAENQRAPLSSAIIKNNTEAAKLLIASKADLSIVDKDLSTALHDAAWKGNTEVVNALIAAGADPNINSIYGTALDFAIEKGHKEVISILISKGATQYDDYLSLKRIKYILTKAITWPIDLVNFFTTTKSLEKNEPNEQEQNLDTTNINLDETECTGLDGSSAAA